MTDRYAVIGNPIDHSKSPLIHGLFAKAADQDMQYSTLLGETSPGGFARAVDAFRAEGGSGMNVTVPFKTDAFAYATELSPDAQLAGAVNALKFEDGRVLGQNFDGIGLVRDVQLNLGLPIAGRRVLVLGAGGATRGALLPLARAGANTIVIANRTSEKARALAQDFTPHAKGVTVQGCGLDALDDQVFDIVFNATSASLGAEMPVISPSVFAPGALAYDLVYGKGLTPFLRLARDAGRSRVVDGVGMLVEQAAEAFEWWRGVRPDTREVITRLTVPLV
ncbi:shikimate dehydrogenase [Ottowia thiooxydans]|uniref:shikimate dehydrogenase n=1 Tax=Ottowia thiooxydans TaxID=219182 RepID=UPI0003FCFCC1|nr:shikimate dehydrogenase [Ottowia thiooxydans]